MCVSECNPLFSSSSTHYAVRLFYSEPRICFQCTQFVGSHVFFAVTSGSLPVGVDLNVTSGVISGIPILSVTNHQVTIRTQNALGSNTATLSFTILLPISFFSYPSASYVLEKGVSISIVPFNWGDSVAASICNGTLPLGLALNAATEIIWGLPSPRSFLRRPSQLKLAMPLETVHSPWK